MRSFIAIIPDQAFLDEIVNFQKYLINSLPDVKRVRFTDKNNLHITVKFLGETFNENEVKELANERNKDIAAIRRFHLNSAKVSYGFEGQRNPSVIIIHMLPHPALSEIYFKINYSLRRKGILSSEEEIIPHITIARTKGFVPLDLRKILSEALEKHEFRASFLVKEIVFLESQITSSSPKYTEIDKISLI